MAQMTDKALAKSLTVLQTVALDWEMDPQELKRVVCATVIKGKDGADVSDEELALFLMVAKKYGLDPFVREIHAFVDKGKVVPIVGIDGWISMVHRQDKFSGFEFEFGKSDDGKRVIWITCRIFRSDWKQPAQATEFMAECARDTYPWKKWPIRQLKHKAFIQCARYAFGFSGIHDDDEAERIEEAEVLRTEDAVTLKLDTAAAVDEGEQGVRPEATTTPVPEFEGSKDEGASDAPPEPDAEKPKPPPDDPPEAETAATEGSEPPSAKGKKGKKAKAPAASIALKAEVKASIRHFVGDDDPDGQFALIAQWTGSDRPLDFQTLAELKALAERCREAVAKNNLNLANAPVEAPKMNDVERHTAFRTIDAIAIRMATKAGTEAADGILANYGDKPDAKALKKSETVGSQTMDGEYARLWAVWTGSSKGNGVDALSDVELVEGLDAAQTAHAKAFDGEVHPTVK